MENLSFICQIRFRPEKKALNDYFKVVLQEAPQDVYTSKLPTSQKAYIAKDIYQKITLESVYECSASISVVNNKERLLIHEITKITENVVLTGLIRYGNTCYINSVIQSLFNITNFREYIVRLVSTKQVTLSVNSYIFHLGSIFKDMIDNQGSKCSNRSFITGLKIRQLIQGDSHEFLMTIVENFSNYVSHQDPNSLREDTFSFSTACLTSVDNILISKTLENNQYLHLNTTGVQTFEDAIKAFFTTTDKNTTVRQYVLTTPQVLIVYINPIIRLSNGSYVKNPCSYIPSSTLDLADYIASPQANQNMFYLSSIIYHEGQLDRGHYVCLNSTDKGETFRVFDDERVTAFSQDVWNQKYDNFTPYLCVYVRSNINKPFNIHFRQISTLLNNTLAVNSEKDNVPFDDDVDITSVELDKAENIPIYEDLYDIFKQEKAAFQYLCNNGVIALQTHCPKCGGLMGIEVRKDKNKEESRSIRIRCNRKTCRYVLDYKKDTIFENSKLGLSHTLMLSYLWLSKVHSVSIKKMTGLSSATVASFLKNIREVVQKDFLTSKRKIGGPGIVVEIDESKFGKRKYNKGHHVEGVWVIGGVERTSERRMFAVPVARRDADTICSVVSEYVEKGSIIYTDCWKGYDQALLSLNLSHYTVNHSKSYVDPLSGVHTNTIEGSWNGIKINIPRRYWSMKNIWVGITEFIWRRNNKNNLWKNLLHLLFTVKITK